MFGPTTGDRVRLGDTGARGRGRARRDDLRRRVQVRRRQGAARRAGPGGGPRRRRRARLRDHERAHRRLDGHLQGRHRHQARPHRRHRQGRATPTSMAGVTPGHGRRRHDRGDRRRGADRHRRRRSTRTSTSSARSRPTRRSRPASRRSSAAAPARRRGTNATTCTPGASSHRADAAGDRRRCRSTSASPARATRSRPEGLVDQIRAGAVGLKLHEDWGTTPAAIDCCLGVADAEDVQVTIHTDTLNESGYVDDSIAAFEGRTIHTYHSEGAGGGHAPDIIRVCGEPNVLPSSHQPDAPVHGQHARRAPRHAHGLSPPRPRDPRGRRVRREPHPRRDDRGRGRPARPRRDQHHLERQPGDGPRRRGRSRAPGRRRTR